MAGDHDDVTVGLSRVGEKGRVQIPFNIREKLDLQPGTQLIMVATEEALVLRRAALLYSKEQGTGPLGRIRRIFTKLPIRNIEEG